MTAIGDHAVQFRATDQAGNTSAVGSVAFRIVEPGEEDTTAPVVTAALAGDRDGDGNYVGTATATLTATDSGSGVATIEYALDGAAFTAYTNPIVVNTAGMHMLHYRATDVAGNTSAEQMSHFTVVEPQAEDTTPPTVAATVAGDRNDDGAYVGGATVTVTATDAELGCGVDRVRARHRGLDGVRRPGRRPRARRAHRAVPGDRHGGELLHRAVDDVHRGGRRHRRAAPTRTPGPP